MFDCLCSWWHQLLRLSTPIECRACQNWHWYWPLLASNWPKGVSCLLNIKTSPSISLFFGHFLNLFEIKDLCIIAFEFRTLNSLLIFGYVSSDVRQGLLESLELIGCTFELTCVNELVHYCSWALILRNAAQCVQAVEFLWRFRWYIHSSTGTHRQASTTSSIAQSVDTTTRWVYQITLLHHVNPILRRSRLRNDLDQIVVDSFAAHRALEGFSVICSILCHFKLFNRIFDERIL